MSARIVAVANQKGGVGKTTTAVNLAACLAEAGERCLLVDLDPQANATSGLGRRANGVSTLDLLDGLPLAQLTRPSSFPNLDLVPAKAELAATSVQLSALEGGERYLSEHGPSFRGLYDLADPSKSRVMHSTGQSGIVFSPLYRRFVAPWAGVRDVPLWADGAPAHVLELAPAP